MADFAYYCDTGAFNPAAALQVGHDPYGDVGWFGSDLVKKVGSAVKSVGKAAAKVGHAVSPVVSAALPYVQTALKAVGPIGMVGSGALGAMAGVLQGKSLKDVGIAAALGAAPLGIDRALQVGLRIAKGDNLLKIGIDQVGQAFKPGSEGAVAFDVAKKLISKGAPKDALAAARRNLANEVQRRAFDTAVGAAARVADQARVPRVNQVTAAARSRANIIAGNRGPKPLNVMPPPAARKAVQLFTGNAANAARAVANGRMTVPAAARQFGAPAAAVRRALASNVAPRFRWMPLSERASSFVQRHAKGAPLSALRVVRGRDTTGLVDDGKVYVVEAGDFPARIAKKLVGADTRWPELIAANPQKKTKASNIGKVFVSLFAGERLNVPKSWQVSKPAPMASPSPVTTLPEIVVSASAPAAKPSPVSVPAPAVDASNQNTAAILQAKSVLVTWSKTDGLNEAGFTDYGIRPEDLSTSFGTRDKFVARSFENWSNRVRKTKLDVDGEMNSELADALRAWAESRSSLPVPVVGGPAPAVVTPPASTPAPVTPFPAATPVVSAPATPVVPSLPPAVLGGATSSEPTPAPVSQGGGGKPPSGEGDLILPIAAATIGGLVFGIPGAIIGGGGALVFGGSKPAAA
jgi:hypothetical protein